MSLLPSSPRPVLKCGRCRAGREDSLPLQLLCNCADECAGANAPIMGSEFALFPLHYRITGQFCMDRARGGTVWVVHGVNLPAHPFNSSKCR